MGVVYTAYDPTLNRTVALELIVRIAPILNLPSGSNARRRAWPAHPNIVRVYDAGAEGEQLFLAMELVEGMDLRRYLAEHRPGATSSRRFSPMSRAAWRRPMPRASSIATSSRPTF